MILMFLSLRLSAIKSKGVTRIDKFSYLLVLIDRRNNFKKIRINTDLRTYCKVSLTLQYYFTTIKIGKTFHRLRRTMPLVDVSFFQKLTQNVNLVILFFDPVTRTDRGQEKFVRRTRYIRSIDPFVSNNFNDI